MSDACSIFNCRRGSGMQGCQPELVGSSDQDDHVTIQSRRRVGNMTRHHGVRLQLETSRILEVASINSPQCGITMALFSSLLFQKVPACTPSTSSTSPFDRGLEITVTVTPFRLPYTWPVPTLVTSRSRESSARGKPGACATYAALGLSKQPRSLFGP